ncbi:MAG TPA: DUF4097 family beta strand repeat-containing protein [candidate division Zixibacteria bacterium]|nr:DUF4097 family beta strand repeat-containing protein [candidate division Zixibacteria bacterium]
MQRIKLPRLLLIGLGLLVLASSALAENWFDFRKEIELNKPLELEIEVTRGEIVLVGGNDNRLIIEAVKRIRGKDWDKSRRIADKIEINVDRFGDAIRLSTEYLPLDGDDRSFFEKIFGRHANAYGDVDFHITLPVTSRIKINAVSARVELSSVTARVDIENGFGSVRCEYLDGPITVRQKEGPIDLQWIEGDIRIKAELGRIWIKQTQGALDLSTEKGNVSVQTELNSPRDYFIETKSGTIEFMVPERSAGYLSIETHSGEIATKVPISIESASRTKLAGAFGAGGPRIEISSVSGDVMVAGF